MAGANPNIKKTKAGENMGKQKQVIKMFGKRWIVTERAETWGDILTVTMFGVMIVIALYVVPAIVVIVQDMKGGA